MKRLINLFLVLIYFLSGYSQNIDLSERIIRQYHNGVSDASLKSSGAHSHLWLTPLLREAVLHWNELTAEARDLFKAYLARPTFTGDEMIFTLGNFAFHYTINGTISERVDPTDADTDGVPDYIENMAALFTGVALKYHTNLGLAQPPSDGEQVNGAFYDVYVSNSAAGGGIYGYAFPESRVGDNPNSAGITETNAYSSYLVLRSNYNGFGDATTAMSVTAAHEYMHAVQFGYNFRMDLWFMEASSTWSEDLAFPGYDDNFQYLFNIFETPDVALNLINGEADGNFDDHWYGAWIFIRYITEHTSDEILRAFYERSIQYDATDAITMELYESWNSNFDEIFEQFVIANAIMTSDPAFEPYTYQRADEYDAYIRSYSGYTREEEFDFSGNLLKFSSASNESSVLMRLSADYFTLDVDQGFKIVFTPLEISPEFDLFLIKLGANKIEIQHTEYAAGQGVIEVADFASWDRYIPVVYRIQENTNNESSFDYEIEISASSILVAPNPVSGHLLVSTGLGTNYEVIIRDMTGRPVIHRILTEQQGTIDVHGLANGVYAVQIIQNGHILRTEKIVVQH